MIFRLLLGVLISFSLWAQTRVELGTQTKGSLPPDKGGTGVSSCLEDEGLIWQSGEFVCSALASGPHASTHQHGGTDEVATATPSNNAIPKAGSDGELADGWLPGVISRDINWTGAQTFKQSNDILLSTEFDWSQDPGVNLVLGTNAVTLSPCPEGVDATNSNHYIFVDDDNNALDEAVLITGGTCTSGASSGTVQFNAANSHTSGQYTVGSATAGIQEAVWALSDNNSSGGGVVYVPPGAHDLFQTLSIGDGTATKTDPGVSSSVNHIRVIGAGKGRLGSGTDNTTVLRWQGPAATDMVVIRGPVENVELSEMHLFGNFFSDQTGLSAILRMFGSQRSTYRNLHLSAGGAGSIGIDLNTFSSLNLFENIQVSNLDAGASALVIGQNNGTGGNSQNVFLRIDLGASHNSSTSYGIYLSSADNNSFYQANVFPRLESTSQVTCGSPTTVTMPSQHNRETGVAIRLLGDGACNGVSLEGEWTITKVDDFSFTLDGSNHTGPYTGSDKIGGPGYSLFLDNASGTNFPVENSFYNCAFQVAFVASDGFHGPNIFLPVSSSDGEDEHNGNTGSGADRFVGIGGPLYFLPNPDWFNRFIGKYSFVRNSDLTSSFARFDADTSQVNIGDVPPTFAPAAEDLFTLRRDGADAIQRIRTATSGDTKLILNNEGNTAYEIVGDRITNSFRLHNQDSGGIDFLEFANISDLLRLRGDVIEFYTDTNGGPNLAASFPNDGGLQLDGTNFSKPTCDAAHQGTLFYTAGGSGVQDKLEVCAKDDADTYGWRTIF